MRAVMAVDSRMDEGERVLQNVGHDFLQMSKKIDEIIEIVNLLTISAKSRSVGFPRVIPIKTLRSDIEGES